MKYDFKKLFFSLIFFGLILVISFLSHPQAFSKSLGSAPHTPQGFSVQAQDGALALSWKANAEWNIFSYKVYFRSETKPKEINSLLVGKRTDYRLENLENGTTYFLSLTAINSESIESLATPEIGIAPTSNQQVKQLKVAAWMPTNWDTEDARSSFESNLGLWDIISPFWYNLEENGKLSTKDGVANPHLINLAKKNSILVIPTITNNYDKEKTSKVLNNQDVLNRHIENIYNEVMVKGYDGIDIDYENVAVEDKARFLEFIQKLAEKLHAQGKLISVTSQPKQSDNDIWAGPGAMDYLELGKIADQFRVMTYDFHRMGNIPGPIAPIDWIKKVADYTKSKVPKEKIYLGIPFYGYDWCISGSGTDGGVVWDGVKNIIDKYKPTVEWDDQAKEPWFLYIDDQKNTQVIYFQNAKSIGYKLDAIKEMDVAGISIWRLGSEDPENFSVIRNKAGKEVNESIFDLTVLPQDQAINLFWQKPKDPKIKGYKIYFRKEGDKNEKSFDAWQKESAQIYGLENGVKYYIRLAPLDENGKIGKKSQEIFAIPQDLAYPGTISDLKIEKVGTDTIDLSWTSPGDEYFQGQAEKFEIRYDTKEITERNFNQAKEYFTSPKPQPSGTKQNWQIRNLQPGLTYWIAIKTIDEAGNKSFISNVVKAQTIDNIPPQIPQGVRAKIKDSKMVMSWEPNSEKDLAGYRIYFKQGNSFYDFVEVTKDIHEYSLQNLENGKPYYISISAYDKTGNESERTKDIEILLKKEGMVAKAKKIEIDLNQIQGALVNITKKILNKEAIPYLILFAICIINFFVYKGLKEEIKNQSK